MLSRGFLVGTMFAETISSVARLESNTDHTPGTGSDLVRIPADPRQRKREFAWRQQAVAWMALLWWGSPVPVPTQKASSVSMAVSGTSRRSRFQKLNSHRAMSQLKPIQRRVTFRQKILDAFS